MPNHDEEPDNEKALLAEDEDDIAVIRERENEKFLTLDELKQRHGWNK